MAVTGVVAATEIAAAPRAWSCNPQTSPNYGMVQLLDACGLLGQGQSIGLPCADYVRIHTRSSIACP